MHERGDCAIRHGSGPRDSVDSLQTQRLVRRTGGRSAAALRSGAPARRCYTSVATAGRRSSSCRLAIRPQSVRQFFCIQQGAIYTGGLGWASLGGIVTACRGGIARVRGLGIVAANRRRPGTCRHDDGPRAQPPGEAPENERPQRSELAPAPRPPRRASCTVISCRPANERELGRERAGRRREETASFRVGPRPPARKVGGRGAPFPKTGAGRTTKADGGGARVDGDRPRFGRQAVVLR